MTRFRLTLVPTLTVLSISPILAQDHPLVGSWKGVYENSEARETLELRVRLVDGALTVEVKATSRYVTTPRFQRAEAVTVDGNAVSFVVNWGGPVTFTGDFVDGILEGDLRTDHWTGTWTAERADGDSRPGAP